MVFATKWALYRLQRDSQTLNIHLWPCGRFVRWGIEPVLFVCIETYALEYIHESDSQIIGKSIPTLSIISNTIKSFLPHQNKITNKSALFNVNIFLIITYWNSLCSCLNNVIVYCLWMTGKSYRGSQMWINIVADDALVLALWLQSVASLLTKGSTAFKWKLHCHWIIGLPQCLIAAITQGSGPRLNIKDRLSRYGDSHVKDKTAGRTSYL